MKKYDVICMGSGGVARITSPAARLGLKVAVVEKGPLGGTCLNRGCIPSKMMIYPADVATLIKQVGKFDIKMDTSFKVDFKKLTTRINDTVGEDSESIEKAYGKNLNIDLYKGHGRFVENKVIEVDGEKITADKIFIGVGAHPFIPPIEGLADTPYMTSTEALKNKKLPERTIVIGGGYIGVELGHAYAALGSDVTFLVRGKMIGREDGEVIEEFEEVFKEQYRVTEAETKKVSYDDVFKLTVADKDGKTKELEAEGLLVATGIKPSTDDLGLENTDIKTNKRGFIEVDDHMRTGAEGVWALGDCVGNYMFRHSVNFEGEYLFRTIFIDKKDEPISYPPMPHAIFSHPEVAGVGVTEDELKNDGKEEGKDYFKGVHRYRGSAMGMARLSEHGFVKLIFEKKSKKLIGAHIVGDEASDMIHILIAHMTMGGTLSDVLGMIYVHPALPEIVRNAARNAKASLEEN